MDVSRRTLATGDLALEVDGAEVAGLVLSAALAGRFARLVSARALTDRIDTLLRLAVAVAGIRDDPDGEQVLDRLPAFAGEADARRWLAERGIGAGLVLAPTEERHLAADLDAVIDRRRQGRVPSIDLDPEWVVSEAGTDPLRRRVREAIFSVAAGGFGVRGAVEEPHPGAQPLVLAAGAYDGKGAQQHLLGGPDWTRLDVTPPPASDVCRLDLHTGVMLRLEAGAEGPPLRSARWASARRDGVMAVRTEAAAGRLRPEDPLVPGEPAEPEAEGVVRSRSAVSGTAGVIAAAAAQRRHSAEGVDVVDRTVALAAHRRRPTALAAAQRRLRSAEQLGFDRLLAEQRRTWAERWRDVDARVPDDPAAQLGIRFALYQLWSHTAHPLELGIGARGVTGDGYAGHVFWDADVYVLPALAAIDPSAARAMLRYRYNRLPAARRRAEAEGRRGARFPWESAATGEEVTPTEATFAGIPLRILTGQQEEHVTADVAWAAAFCAEWEGRAPSRLERALIVEAARYWASRCRLDGDGRAHVEGVIGPDEYHEGVTDDAYTNVMARWNLRRAADLAAHPDAAEPASWRRLADALVDGYDPATGRYEQFAGYFALPDLTVADVAPPPVAADLLLGVDTVAATRLIKQPDVLMLHHLVPEETAPGSLEPNLAYYLPRTAHGSSLSPAISAALLARGGQPDAAADLLDVALRLDLDDLTGTTASGLHLATVGGVWQCLLSGFGGVRVRDRCLHVDPCLPARWPQLELRFRALGRRIRLRVTADLVTVQADGAVGVRHGDQLHYVTATQGAQFERGS